MKKIIFLIFGLMSFTASADMEKLWVDREINLYTEAWCIFADKDRKHGSTYLYIYHNNQRHERIVEPYLDWNTGKVQKCYRPSLRD